MKASVNKSYLLFLPLMWCLFLWARPAKGNDSLVLEDRVFKYISGNLNSWCQVDASDWMKGLLTLSAVCELSADEQMPDDSRVGLMVKNNLIILQTWAENLTRENIRTESDLIRFYFQVLNMGVDTTGATPHAATHLYLNRVIETRTGNCLSLSVLFLYLAECLGLDINPILIPGHFMLSSSVPPDHRFIETTLKGQYRDASKYMEEFKIPLRHSLYMRPLGLQELFGVYLNNLGNVLVKKNLLKEARLFYEQALERIPEDSSVHLNLATVCAYLKDFDSELYHFQQAAMLNPLDVQIRANMAASLAEKSQFKEAYDLLKSIQPELENDANFWYRLAYCAIFTEHWEEAREAIERFHQIENNDNPDIYYLRSLFYLRQGQWVKWIRESLNR